MLPLPTEKQEGNTLLELHHEDYSLYVVSQRQEDVWNKAASLINDIVALQTEYRWSKGARLFLKDETPASLEGETEEESQAECHKVWHALFFENTDYQVEVVFHERERVEGVTLLSPLFLDEKGKKESRACYMAHRGVLPFTLNYGNDIGQSDIEVEYRKDGEMRRLWLHFDVLSTKLDYHKDLRCILEDIEREYTMLSLAFLRKTYHTFTVDNNATETPDLIWWNIFKDVQEEFCWAVSKVIDSPHNRLRVQHNYRRADQLRHVTPALENEWKEHKEEERRLYRTVEWVPNDDTVENRFVKFAINNIKDRYRRLKEQIEAKNKSLPKAYLKGMKEADDTLTRLSTVPFLRRIGRFTGLKGENLTLKQATGYSTIYRDWLLLQSTYDLHDGIQRMELKDIATLYEIWCFIEVSHIVQEQLHLKDDEVDHRNRMEMGELFDWQLGKGEHSRILFRKDGVEMAELVYNPKSTEKVDDDMGLADVVVPTVPQKPDIVLQLTKDDLHTGMKMTYLFDAKYRIKGREGNGVDTPPDDAINQMHRYRDAIYYRRGNTDDALKKEVIGGYILFPDDGTPLDIQKERFYKSIEEVNIGAFPLRPKDKMNRKLLEDFIAAKINTKGHETIAKVIPQKGAIVEVGNRVLIGLVKEDNPQIGDFKASKGTLYYSGDSFPSTIKLSNLHYFMPYIKGQGIKDVYEITSIHTIPESMAKGRENQEGEVDNLRIAFDVEFDHRWFTDYKKVELNIRHTYMDTSFDDILSLITRNPI